MNVLGPLRTWRVDQYGKYTVETSLSIGHLVSAGAVVCPECAKPFGARIRCSCSTSEFWSAKSPDKTDQLLDNGRVEIWPKPSSEFKLNENLPLKIQKPFVEIQEDSHKRRNPIGILSVARGCLDVALKELGEEKGGRRERINNLAKRGIITHGIADWAQTLWEDGSDAVHDLEATIENAVEHVEFLELFFDVAFVLPKRIASVAHDENVAKRSPTAAETALQPATEPTSD